MQSHFKSFVFTAFSAIVLCAALVGCEDDPILAPASGSKQANGSYGIISIAPPVDSSRASDRPTTPPNPELY